MNLDFWFLLIIALIGIAAILTAWMLSEHFRLEKEKMERDALHKISQYDEAVITGYHRTETKVHRKVLATATVRVLPRNYTGEGRMCCQYQNGNLDCRITEGVVC